MNPTALSATLCVLILCILLLVVCTRCTGCRKVSVGIIGGGVSGLAAARRIAASADHVATVLEKGSEIVPIVHRVVNYPNVYGMDLVFIPGISWSGYGPETRWRRLLRRENVKLSPATAYLSSIEAHEDESKPFKALNILGQQPMKAFEEACRLIKHLQPFFKNNQYLGVEKCIEEEIAYARETFGNWYLRHNYKVIGPILVESFAALGNLPVMTGPACTVLMLLSSKLPPLLSNILGTVVLQYEKYGISTQFLTKKLPAVAKIWLQGLIKYGAASQLLFCEDGYGSFFRSVVRNMNIDYRTNVHVYKIQPTRSGIFLYTKDGSTYKFDKVLVAARPDHAVEFLPIGHLMTNLYHLASQYIRGSMFRYGVYSSGVVSATPSKNSRVDKTNRTHYVLYMHDNFENITKDMVNQDDITVMRVYKFHEGGNIISLLWQTPVNLINTPSESASIVRILNHLGYEKISFLSVVHYPRTPSHLSSDLIGNDWYGMAKRLQGVNNIFFVGEVFSGHGVPTSWLYAERFVKKMLHLRP